MGAAIAAATLPISASAQSKDIKVGFLLPDLSWDFRTKGI
jgi:ABC-type sugar transport system substrate-binding protein